MTPTALLESLGLPQYRHAFYQNGVFDQEAMLGVDDAALQTFGVADPAHRAQILEALAELGSSELADDDSEESDDDPASLDQHDGRVSPELESDDDTDLFQQEPAFDEGFEEGFDEAEEPSSSALGRLLIALIVVVLLAAGAGWVVIQEALQPDEPSPVGRLAQPLAIPAPPPVPEAPAASAEPSAPALAEPSAPAQPPEVILPSFPCSKAESRVELLICGSASLATLDRRMAKIYSGARKGLDAEASAEIRAAQKRWLRARDACTDADCVSSRYSERLAELE